MGPLLAVDVSTSLQQGLDSLFGFIPNLIGFFVILIVGYFIAKIVKSVIAKVLDKVGLDHQLHSGQTGEYVERVSPGASPARLIASVVFWFIFLFVLSAAIGALKIPAVTAFMNQVLAYLPNVIVAVLIFVVAGVVAAAVAGLVAKTMGDTPTGKVVASVVPAQAPTGRARSRRARSRRTCRRARSAPRDRLGRRTGRGPSPCAPTDRRALGRQPADRPSKQATNPKRRDT